MTSSESDDIPPFADLAADPEIAPLLEFEPAPRQVERPNGWTPDLQRELVARIADTGSPGKACDAMGKNLSGAKHLYRTEGADSFRAAWTAAIALAAERKRAARAASRRHPDEVPGIGGRRKPAAEQGPLPGEVRNEYGEWEQEESFAGRVEDARDSIAAKLRRVRRLYLQEISGCPGKRAAFEILTELPVDWDKAARLEPQPDEPWRRPTMRQPDMLLAAEAGWLGDLTHGRNRIAEAQQALNEYRAKQGLEPIDWSADAPLPLPSAGEGGSRSEPGEGA